MKLNVALSARNTLKGKVVDIKKVKQPVISRLISAIAKF